MISICFCWKRRGKYDNSNLKKKKARKRVRNENISKGTNSINFPHVDQKKRFITNGFNKKYAFKGVLVFTP